MGIYKDREKANALLRRARALSKQKKYGEVEKLMDAAIEDCPRGAFYVTRGVSRKKQGLLEEALSDYDIAITSPRRLPEAYVNKAVVLYTLKRYQECIENFMVGFQIGYSLNSKHIKMMMNAKERL